MLNKIEVMEAINERLPQAYHRPAVLILAQIICDIVNEELTTKAAESVLVDQSIVKDIISQLSGQQISTGKAAVLFGAESQVGDIKINDIVNGNIYNLSLSLGSHSPPDETNLEAAASIMDLVQKVEFQAGIVTQYAKRLASLASELKRITFSQSKHHADMQEELEELKELLQVFSDDIDSILRERLRIKRNALRNAKEEYIKLAVQLPQKLRNSRSTLRVWDVDELGNLVPRSLEQIEAEKKERVETLKNLFQQLETLQAQLDSL